MISYFNNKIAIILRSSMAHLKLKNKLTHRYSVITFFIVGDIHPRVIPKGLHVINSHVFVLMLISQQGIFTYIKQTFLSKLFTSKCTVTKTFDKNNINWLCTQLNCSDKIVIKRVISKFANLAVFMQESVVNNLHLRDQNLFNKAEIGRQLLKKQKHAKKFVNRTIQSRI